MRMSRDVSRQRWRSILYAIDWLHSEVYVCAGSRIVGLHDCLGLHWMCLCHLAAEMEEEARGQGAREKIVEVCEEDLVPKRCDVEYDDASDAEKYDPEEEERPVDIKRS